MPGLLHASRGSAPTVGASASRSPSRGTRSGNAHTAITNAGNAGMNAPYQLTAPIVVPGADPRTSTYERNHAATNALLTQERRPIAMTPARNGISTRRSL